jgi:hypothetical protein
MSGPYSSGKSKGKRSYKHVLVVAAIIAVSFLIFFWSYDTWYNVGASVEASQHYAFGNTSTITIIVSNDFGHETLLNTTIPYQPGMSALRALQKVAEVDVDGTGFVNAINGVRSQYTGMGADAKPVDWFYYVNGIFATVYSTAYTMHPGDVMRWDYHAWNENNAMGGLTDHIVGDLFAGFAYGYGGKVPPAYIVDTGGYEEEAEKVGLAFREWGLDAKVVKASELDAKVKNEGSLVLIGTFESPVIFEVNDNYDSLGLLCHYIDGKVEQLDYLGNVNSTLDECGIVGAVKSPFNLKGSYLGENVIWMCTGTSEEHVRQAVDLMIGHPETLKETFGCVIINGTAVYGVP